MTSVLRVFFHHSPSRTGWCMWAGATATRKNVALAEEIRRTFADVDRVEDELKKAAKAIGSASMLVTKYRLRLNSLCDNTGAQKKPPQRQQDNNVTAQAG